jgi:transcriptional regulator with XRE-family HTH domain
MAERDPRIIGARIAERRHQLDMTQVELAAALGVSPSSVADWERGASYPRRKMGKVKQLLGSGIDRDDQPQASVTDAEALDRALEAVRQIFREQEQQGKDHDNANGDTNGGTRRAG